MTDGGRPPHAVLLRAPEKFSPPAVAAVLARRAKAPALDFLASSRRAWGLIAESLPAADADSLAADLTAAGLPSVAAPQSLVESPPEAVALAKADLRPDGFEIVAARVDVPAERLAWTRLSALCAASVEIRGTKTVTATEGPELAERAVRMGIAMATGLPVMKGSKEVQKKVETRDRAFVVDLLFAEPSRRLRVDARAFDYSLLGSKMGYGADANFAALVAELAERAPAALRGRGTRALLSKRAASDLLYESLDELEREERWLFTLSVLKAAL